MAQRGNIDTFKSNVYSDFARPNLFQVDINFPTDIGVESATALKTLGNFVVRAANLPASQIGVVEVPFRGRVLKLAGDRTFEPWTFIFDCMRSVISRKNFSVIHPHVSST